MHINNNNNSETLTVYIDGASKGNPGKSGVGFLIEKNSSVIFSHGYFIGQATNNQAEYMACIAVLSHIQECIKPIESSLIIYADSLLLIKQIQGAYRVKNPVLQLLHKEVTKLLNNFTWQAHHIAREKNSRADDLANKSIEYEIKPPLYLCRYISYL